MLRVAPLLITLAVLNTGCDDDTALAPFAPVMFLEDFQEAENGTALDIAGWGNFAEDGILWHEETYSGNGYAAIENMSDATTTSWLVSPPIALNDAESIAFQSAQHHLSQNGNSLEAFISTDYTGDVATATWQPLEAIVAGYGNQWYGFIHSGEVSLSAYSGTVHFAFKATINGQGGAYFIDNVKVY